MNYRAVLLPTLWMVAAIICVVKGEWTAAAVLAVGAGFYERGAS